MRMNNLEREVRITITMMLLLFLLPLNTDLNTRMSTYVEQFMISDDSGPVFDLTALPDFVTLVPGSEPVILTLELIVRVSDPDDVDTVIGSYSNRSQNWVNITLEPDDSTNSTELYSAQALNYTVPGGYSVTIWHIRYYANDSLGNWNVSQLKTLSVSRQPGPPWYGNVPVGLLVVATIMIPLVISIFLIRRRRRILVD
ncbi:MAG: hypothetical protein ACXABY_27285 [Candidatus Thorarchaeota archaeon]